MRKTLYALLMCTVGFGPAAVFASQDLEDVQRPVMGAPVQVEKPGVDKGLEEGTLDKEGKADKKPLSLDEKGQALQDLAVATALGKVGIENTKDNRDLAVETGKAAVQSVQKNANLFKDALEATKAKTANKVQARADEGLETSKVRKGFTAFRYGAWEFTKATAKTTVNFVKDNPELVAKIVITAASALLLA